MEPKKNILYHRFDEEVHNMHQMLWHRLNSYSENLNRISGLANWIIVSPEVANMLNETNTQESNGFETVIFPIVRRVYARYIEPNFSEKTDFSPIDNIKKHKL
jgi:hypothetical protein